jgi:large subunit ribosomal protein L5
MARSTYTPNLKKLYLDTIVPEIKSEFKLKNQNQVPKLNKIVLNVGLGRSKDDKKMMEVATNTLAKISGQAPIQTKAKKSIAAFKLREGNVIGLKVTLRGNRMYEFLDRMINIVMPRQHDFHGVKLKSFDKSGNFSIGFVDQSVFPELSFEETTTAHGISIVINFNNGSKELSKEVLTRFGMPFEKENN